MKATETMTGAEMRVAIAKDVIKQVEAGKYQTEDAMGYMHIRFASPLPAAAVDLRDVVDLPMVKCEVCAKGAMLLSRARLFDGVPLGPLVYGHDLMGYEDSMLVDVFGEDNASLIEVAFEQWDPQGMGIESTEHPDYPRFLAAYEFGMAIAGRDDRLVAIMANVEENGGTFNP